MKTPTYISLAPKPIQPKNFWQRKLSNGWTVGQNIACFIGILIFFVVINYILGL